MLAAILTALLGANDWRTRDWTQRHAPWPVVAMFVPANHPDAEVRLRWRKIVPQWYRELTPTFLRILIHRTDEDFDTPEKRAAFLKIGWRYTTWWVSEGCDDSAMCAMVYDSLKAQQPVPLPMPRKK